MTPSVIPSGWTVARAIERRISEADQHYNKLTSKARGMRISYTLQMLLRNMPILLLFSCLNNKLRLNVSYSTAHVNRAYIVA